MLLIPTFLSTYPVRGTTTSCVELVCGTTHFYPRTPCGVRPPGGAHARTRTDISIHVPRAGYDSASSEHAANCSLFLSTYPVRGTTSGGASGRSDSYYFYPRTPCGVRPGVCGSNNKEDNISIHVPRAGYDFFRDLRGAIKDISIHVPRAGYDRTGDFVELAGGNISIHVPRAGYDRRRARTPTRSSIFLSTYPVRGTTAT